MGTSYPCAAAPSGRRSGQRIHQPDEGGIMAITAVFEFPGEPVEKYRKVFDDRTGHRQPAGPPVPRLLPHRHRLHRHRYLGRRTVLRRLRRDPRPGPAPRWPRRKARRLPSRAGHDARRHPIQLARHTWSTGGAAPCRCLLHRLQIPQICTITDQPESDIPAVHFGGSLRGRAKTQVADELVAHACCSEASELIPRGSPSSQPIG